MTSQTTDYPLTLGEAYEDFVADRLTALGLPTRRLQQVFISALDQSYSRQISKRCRIEWDERTQRYAPRDLQRDLLRPFQIDLALKISPVKMRLIEVKALTPAAFDWSPICFGKIEKYDQKRLPVHYVMLVNQESQAIFVVPDRSEWLQKRLCGELAYACKTADLVPLETWAEQFKTLHL